VFARAVLVLALTALGAQAQDDPAALVVRLSSERLEERDQAATALRALGDRAVPALERALGSSDAEVRLRSNQLLHEVSAVSILVEDLRSDEIPGNARAARNALLRRYDETVKKALLETVKSDDAQQALEAAFVLVNKGEAAAVYQAEPRLLAQSIGMFVRGEDDGFHWVAAQVLLRLGSAAGPLAEAAAYRKALAGVAPSALDGKVLQLGETCIRLKAPFPGPFLRRYFENLRDDNRSDNASQTGRVVRMLGDLLVPELHAYLADRDAQARAFAASILLDLKVKDLPPAALPVLGEILGRDGRALGRLVSFGPAALPILEDRIDSLDPPTALRAAQGLALLDHDRWWKRAVQVALSNLETDNFSGNAKEAAGFLVRLGAEAAPLVREALGSDDEQKVACAVGILAGIGQPAAPEKRTVEQLYRLAAGKYGDDETGCLHEVLMDSRPLREAVFERLALSGQEGRRRAAFLEDALEKADRQATSWFGDKFGGTESLIRRR